MYHTCFSRHLANVRRIALVGERHDDALWKSRHSTIVIHFHRTIWLFHLQPKCAHNTDEGTSFRWRASDVDIAVRQLPSNWKIHRFSTDTVYLYPTIVAPRKIKNPKYRRFYVEEHILWNPFLVGASRDAAVSLYSTTNAPRSFKPYLRKGERPHKKLALAVPSIETKKFQEPLPFLHNQFMRRGLGHLRGSTISRSSRYRLFLSPQRALRFPGFTSCASIQRHTRPNTPPRKRWPLGTRGLQCTQTCTTRSRSSWLRSLEPMR